MRRTVATNNVSPGVLPHNEGTAANLSNSQTLHGTAIGLPISCGWGGQSRHIWQSHGVFGLGIHLGFLR